jgi:hypothetical protein
MLVEDEDRLGRKPGNELPHLGVQQVLLRPLALDVAGSPGLQADRTGRFTDSGERIAGLAKGLRQAKDRVTGASACARFILRYPP